jgi:hypothetical protein
MHPDPDAVLAYVDAPVTLAADLREEVGRHLATCRSCADEVRTLRRADLGRLVADVAASPAAARRRPARAIARVLWHPAFAYALVLALLLPILRDQLGPGAESPAESRKVAETRPDPHSRPAEPAGDHATAPPRLRSAERRHSAESERSVPAGSRDDAAGAKRSASPEEERVANAPAFSDSAARSRAAETSAPVLALGTGDPAVVPYATARQRGVVLRIAPPDALVPGPVDVRVRSRVGGRELVTRVADRADAMVVTIPRRWLTPGDYEVTVTPAAPPESRASAQQPDADAARALPGAPSADRPLPDAERGTTPLLFTVAPPAGEAAR